MEHQLDEKGEKVIQSVDIQKLIAEILENFIRDTTRLGINISVNIDQRVKLFVDAHLIKVLIQNIIENAIQFHDASKTERWIKIHGGISSKNCLITISDNGIGINDREKINIYDLFFQASTESQGQGVGLYVVRAIAAKMGGGIMIDSKPGQGSKFMILIPNGK